MSALYLLIGFSLLVALAFLALFLWAMKNDQYRDTYTPALRILFDRAEPHPPDPSRHPSQPKNASKPYSASKEVST